MQNTSHDGPTAADIEVSRQNQVVELWSLFCGLRGTKSTDDEENAFMHYFKNYGSTDVPTITGGHVQFPSIVALRECMEEAVSKSGRFTKVADLISMAGKSDNLENEVRKKVNWSKARRVTGEVIEKLTDLWAQSNLTWSEDIDWSGLKIVEGLSSLRVPKLIEEYKIKGSEVKLSDTEFRFERASHVEMSVIPNLMDNEWYCRYHDPSEDLKYGQTIVRYCPLLRSCASSSEEIFWKGVTIGSIKPEVRHRELMDLGSKKRLGSRSDSLARNGLIRIS